MAAVCQACGFTIETGARFCSRCGATVAPESTGPASGTAFGAAYAQQPYVPGPAAYPGVPTSCGKVARHLRRLGILWCVYAGYRVLTGIGGMFFFSAIMTHRFGNWPFPTGSSPMFPPAFMAMALPAMATLIILSGALALATGLGLIYGKPWGRVLAIIAGILALFKFPVGTALGIYTLWVLAPGVSGAEYDAIADRS